jgi:hypothetical protein
MTAIFVLVVLDVFGMATTGLVGPYVSAENQNVSSVNVKGADILYNLTI